MVNTFTAATDVQRVWIYKKVWRGMKYNKNEKAQSKYCIEKKGLFKELTTI